jgi:glycerophosphoryl diester phosphodiesterase
MWPYPKILAHRGGGILAPENTLAAMRLAKTRGFRAVEFDVMLARDGIPVLMHDPQLGRTVPGHGPVNAHTAAQLQAMDAGSWLAPEFAGEPVPSFAAVAAFCRANGIWMNVEIKPAPGVEADTGAAVAQEVQRLFADVPAGDFSIPLLSSFSLAALHAAREAAPELPRGWLVERMPSDWLSQCAALGVVSLNASHRHLDRATAQHIKNAGLGLFCYTVNDPIRAAELLSWGVDAFCTDRIDLIGPDFDELHA